MHAKKEGTKGWLGSVDGEIPEEKLQEFRACGKARSGGPVDGVCARAIGSDASASLTDSAVVPQALGLAASVSPPATSVELDLGQRSLLRDAALPREGVSALGEVSVQEASAATLARQVAGVRSRIVTGFGSERVDDVAADETRRIADGARRGDQRREDGSRGRMTDFSGTDLDRSAGGAWRIDRR
jgi:hypothetical protein